MDNILPDNEFVEVEGRVYSNPQTGLDESQSFIENLRSTQDQQNQQIATDTYNLGTAVPSVQGGLGAPTDAGLSYFTSRYQTPQTNATVANLRAVAQAAALNEVLANEQEMWKNRYQQAYRKYQKSAYNKANASSGGSSGGGNTSGWDGEVEDEVISDSGTEIQGAVPGVSGGHVIANFDPETGAITGYTGVPYGEDYETNYHYSYKDGAPKNMPKTLPQSSSTVLSGDKTKYLNTKNSL